MSLTAFGWIVPDGKIRLRDNVLLPEKARVFLVVDAFASPATIAGAAPAPFVRSPRLARPEQASDFRKQVVAAPRAARL